MAIQNLQKWVYSAVFCVLEQKFARDGVTAEFIRDFLNFTSPDAFWTSLNEADQKKMILSKLKIMINRNIVGYEDRIVLYTPTKARESRFYFLVDPTIKYINNGEKAIAKRLVELFTTKHVKT